MRSQAIDAIMETLVLGSRHPLGIAGILIDTEVAAGGTPYDPGEDWVKPAVVIQRGKEVRIVAVAALRPGEGALKRLIARIREDGCSPVIVEPVGSVMPAILQRWGWKMRRIGKGFEHTDEWRPA